MRLFILATCLTLSGLLQAHNLKGQDLNKVFLSLQLKNSDLKTAFKKIEAQTAYRFTYKSEDVQQYNGLNFTATHESLEHILTELLKKTDLGYEQVDQALIIKKVPETAAVDPPTQPQAAKLPAISVTGKVTDELGNPLPGVNVRIKGSSNGTTTDKDGAYRITVPDDNTIITFSYIGFESQELKARDVPPGSVITLKALVQSLREVVVDKGYYKERQELSTGDVSVVGSKEIGEQPVSDPIQALIGRVAGLDIQQGSGIPGASNTILIRGVNSIANGTAPLFIIDDIPFSSISLSSPGTGNALGYGGGYQKGPVSASANGESPFNALNPADIESITVLKDADATAIYGSRGANGVILITTKKGKPGATRVNIDLSQGIGQVGHFMDLLNTQQYLAMRHQAIANDGLPFPSINTSPTNSSYDINGFWDTTRNTNWQKALIGNTAHYTNVQGSVSGGNANTQFLIGGGYNQQTTVFPADYGDTKGSAHFSLTHTSDNQRFKVQFTASYINDTNDVPIYDLTQFIALPPDAPPLTNPDGSINWAIRNGTATFNPQPLARTLFSSTSVTKNLLSSLMLSYQLLKGLDFKTTVAYNNDEMDENFLTPASAYAPPNNTNPSYRSTTFSNSLNQSWNIEPLVQYEKEISKGKLDILVGTTFQQSTSQNLGYYSYGFSSDALLTNPLAASSTSIASYNNTLYRYTSLYGRIGYNWEEKYLLNITARRDGSSRFGPGKEFGNFGAIGAGWIFSKEKSISDNLTWLSFGKIRGSYGTTGNDQMADYQYLSTYKSNSTTYQGTAGLAPTSLTNPYYAWEVIKKLEAGIDLGFLKDRINLSVNYYRDRTDNQLVGYPLSSVTGFSTVQYNLPAIVQNTGLEVELNTVNFKTKDFNWSSSVNFTLPQNELVAYPGLASSSYKSTYIIGQSLFIKKVYQYTGVNPQTGLYTFATQNASGIPSSPQDQIATAPITQKYYGGIQNTFSYKGFSFDVFFQFVKQLGKNYLANFSGPGIYNSNEPTVVLNNWKNPGDISNIQKFGGTTFSTPSPYSTYSTLQSSNAAYSDASFIRLKNVALSYKLPASWQQWAHMQSARVYLQAQNLFTITNYLGLDPETQGLTLPPLRMITAGVSATF